MPEPTATTGPNAVRRGGKLRLAIVLAIIAAAIGGGAMTWHGVKDRFVPKRFGTVEPGQIYRSAELSPSLVKQTLASRSIRVVVDLTGAIADDPEQQAESRVIAELGIEQLRFPLRGDGTGDIRRYAEAIAAIHRAVNEGRPVLVHCSAGTERTGGVVACYRTLVQRRPVAEAYDEMLSYGWSPKRNKALVPYLNSHAAELARMLADDGVIDKVPDPLPVFGP